MRRCHITSRNKIKTKIRVQDGIFCQNYLGIILSICTDIVKAGFLIQLYLKRFTACYKSIEAECVYCSRLGPLLSAFAISALSSARKNWSQTNLKSMWPLLAYHDLVSSINYLPRREKQVFKESRKSRACVRN